MGYNLEDTMPTQPHTYKKFIEKHAQSTQKDLKSSPKDSKNVPKTILFEVTVDPISALFRHIFESCCQARIFLRFERIF